MDGGRSYLLRGFACLCFLRAALALGTLDAEVPPPKKVLAIEIQGLKRVPESEVRKLIKVRVGNLFSSKAVDEDVKRLWQSHKFAHVQGDKAPLNEGCKVIYVLEENPVLAEVKFIYNKHFSAKKLQQATGLKPPGPLDEFLLFRARQAVERLYQEAGYQFVRVEQTRHETSKGTGVSFTIYEGPRVRVRRVDFTGNQTFSNRQLAKLLKTKAYRFILRKGLFDPELLEEDLGTIRNFYSDHGFRDVEVDCQLSYSEDRSALLVVININENTRYVIESIILAGVHIFPKEELRARLSSRQGDFYSAQAHRDDQKTILSAYGNRGYIMARVSAQITYLTEPAGRLALTYKVAEGERIFVEEIKVIGNYKSKSEVIRRELGLYPGEQFDRTKLIRARERLINTRFFSSVKVDTEPGTAPNRRDLVIEVEEARTGHFGIGGGYSSDFGVVGQLSFVQRNFDWRDWPEGIGDFFQGTGFAGGGQQLRVNLRPASEYTALSLSFEEPYLWGTRNSLGLSAWRWESSRWQYEETRDGGSLSLGRRLRPDLTGRIFLRSAEVRVKNIEVDAPADVFKAEGRHTINTIGLGATYDRRDSLLLPSAGYRVSGSYEYGGRLTAGDIDLHQISLEAQKYHTLFKTDRGKYILSGRALLGLVKPIDDSDEVPFFERLYAGGIGSIRGFDIRGLGPHDKDEPIGGELRAIGNLELNCPIYKDVIRGVLFYDMGQVAYKSDDLCLSDFRSSVGAELRFTLPTPFGPLPLSFALGFPLDPKPEDEVRHFNFAMGALF